MTKQGLVRQRIQAQGQHIGMQCKAQKKNATLSSWMYRSTCPRTATMVAVQSLSFHVSQTSWKFHHSANSQFQSRWMNPKAKGAGYKIQGDEFKSVVVTSVKKPIIMATTNHSADCSNQSKHKTHTSTHTSP